VVIRKFVGVQAGAEAAVIVEAVEVAVARPAPRHDSIVLVRGECASQGGHQRLGTLRRSEDHHGGTLAVGGVSERREHSRHGMVEVGLGVCGALSEPEAERAGFDTASMKCRATARGDDWILNGHKSLDHQRWLLRLLHRPRRHRPPAPVAART